ncbi:dicarboxylate/amino acid:cation symporter [Mangrovibacterium lignilyticum]|uniref:dicarboxylate/amino acid:cation symporter n=1 Tax=Mangrovibacterium lignilyticum TaxID=2668052 RepID=UPI0013CF51C9|nr:dicarboxylate/amino acid:cation symporter [Mangrovibacterium lignilyticum]
MSTRAENKEPKTRNNDLQNSQSKILWGIIIGIILGTMLGGWLPEFAVKLKIIGDVFLNSLIMLVIPLVMLSLIVGITQMGHLKDLGSIGGKTVIYYLVTTFVAALIGIIAVNLLKPGVGIQHGEDHPDYVYTLRGEQNRTVSLHEAGWNKSNYSDKYVVILTDQQIMGMIESQTDSSLTVKVWEGIEDAEKVYIRAEDGTRLPFVRLNGELTSREPKVELSGRGVAVNFGVSEHLQGKERATFGNTIYELLAGNKETGKQGMVPSNIFIAMLHMDILPLIFFSLLLGAALSSLGDKAANAIRFFSILNDAVMKLVYWIMIVSPVGIFGLITARIGEAGGFSLFIPELISLGKFTLVVIVGLSIHGMIILPVILKVIGKQHLHTYVKGLGTTLLNAFSTASSTATLPLTLEGVVKENKISKKTASFVLPLGATVNMDGTALYQAVAAIFIAQVYGIQLEPVMQIIIFLTATLSAIGAAGIPEAGLVTMLIVLKAVDLPVEGLGLLLSIDWLLDRFRTVINVWGDCVGAAVVDHLEANR